MYDEDWGRDEYMGAFPDEHGRFELRGMGIDGGGGLRIDPYLWIEHECNAMSVTKAKLIRLETTHGRNFGNQLLDDADDHRP